MSKIVLFGLGAMSKLLTENKKADTEIVAYLSDRETGTIYGVPIVSFEALKSIDYDYIVVAFGNVKLGLDILESKGIDKDKILGYACSGMTYNNSPLQLVCESTRQGIVKAYKTSELFDLPEPQNYVCGMNVPLDYDVIEKDFVREQSFSFLAREIYRRNVQGAIAEVGVSAGYTAKKLNKLFPDRKLYLYDTYNGLPESDKEDGISRGWGEKQYALVEHGTSVDDVLSVMPYEDKCIIKQGRFPDTFEEKEQFALVHIDVDFYDTIKSALKLFYPLVSKGGYVIVHDYYNIAYEDDTKRAVQEFCDKNELGMVPLTDAGGSIVITK